MRHYLKPFWICVIFLLPIATHAEITGDIILRPPVGSFGELWSTTIQNPEVGKRISDQDAEIEGLSVQKNGDLITTLISGQGFVTDIYLIEGNRRRARNLTHGGYNIIYDHSISVNGDIVFTNVLDAPPETRGLYLIPATELHKNTPNIKMLKRIDVFSVDFSPDGKQVIYDNREGIFIINIKTRVTEKVHTSGHLPVFSPNKRKIAFTNGLVNGGSRVLIVSLLNPLDKTVIALPPNKRMLDLQWSADGEYIIYSMERHDRLYYYYAAPVDGGEHQPLFQNYGGKWVLFDWQNSILPIDPRGLLTTTWSQLKLSQ